AAAALLRRLGRRRVGLLAGPAHSPSATSRQEGFLESWAPQTPLWIREAPFTLDLPRQAVKALADPALDAVFAASDVMAIGALRTLHELGRRIPEDVMLIGYDDIPWAALVEPQLTTIRQPVAALGECAVATLEARIAAPDSPAVHHILPISLIERASTIMSGGTARARHR
ncbi:LacI family DNA-binding transcriptional regulator, partial [Acidocella sp. MX-AZ02]|uniref:LacI family DNA-binding transcriptional regulator n=3 Tax=Acidocellaceae TaxID=3385905 RepID=UPI00028E828B